MFEDAAKISKAIDNLVKIAEGLENYERKAEMTDVIYRLSYVHQSVLGDLTKNSKKMQEYRPSVSK